MTKQSRYSYADTVARLSKAIVDGGATIFATVDQSRAAESAGMKLRPTTLLLFGNPKAGTPLMDAFPLFALELPLRMLVWEEAGTVQVAFPNMTELAAKYGVTGKDAVVGALDHALDHLSAAVA